MADQSACAQRALPGTDAAFRAWSLRKKSPSRAIAKETRAPDRIRPLTHPKVETMIAAAMTAAAPDPKRPVAAAVATRSSGARWIPAKGRTFRYDRLATT